MDFQDDKQYYYFHEPKHLYYLIRYLRFLNLLKFCNQIAALRNTIDNYIF